MTLVVGVAPDGRARGALHLAGMLSRSGTEEDVLLCAVVPSPWLVHRARSAPAGLLEVAEQRDATAIVLGSSAAGVLGQVTLGSVSDRLLHSSHVPLALTPRGYRCRPISAWRA